MMTIDNDKFLAVVNKNLTISSQQATEEMQDAATVAHKCIKELSSMLDMKTIPAGFDKDGALQYSPLTPSLVNAIAQANNTAMNSLRKIRRLDVEDDSAKINTGIDALLRAAHSKITLTQTTQSITIDNNSELDDII